MRWRRLAQERFGIAAVSGIWRLAFRHYAAAFTAGRSPRRWQIA